ncbi:hypothetical protein FHS43_000553 [Streptosporangium becharense]|uniref:Uncharacterized protein n=1 Tax=Streptosporangium becharense TaxID=1816182 RepID=A0A7W9INU2_9ACTN|nr:hypothetical protein [Streptosporangium becharense]MBB2909307.1 hypothetical protein [Streptosporangium becharense]MBB5823790.1 hypothetical protein [Streptosporangium becharense]
MFEIRDDLGHRLGQVPTFERAEELLEDLCRAAHAQAVAHGEGTSDLWHRFTVTDTTTGEQVAFRSYNPDPDRPYEPLNQEDR